MTDGKIALVTGGAGFIGSYLAESLLEDGYEVLVLDDLSTGSLRNIRHLIGRTDFHFESGSVLDKGICNQLISRAHLVFHLAAAVGVNMVFNQPMETIECNVKGTENVLECCMRHGRKVFIASTSEVYGKDPTGDSGMFSETDPIILGPSMRWCYACSKALDEYLARAYFLSKGLPVVIGRIFNTVGPRQSGAYGMVIPRFVQWALAGKPIQVYGDGQQSRTFNHVSDTVGAIRKLMSEPRAEGNIFNIGGKEVVRILELAERIKKLAGSESEIEIIPYEQAYGEGFEDIRNRVPNITKISALIDYEPRHQLNDILKGTITYARDDLGLE